MDNVIDLISSIKKIALDVYENSKPVAIFYGKVTSATPIEICIEQKLTLTSAQLICCDLGENTLEIDDLVVLLRQQGGQKYLILNKVVNVDL